MEEFVKLTKERYDELIELETKYNELVKETTVGEE